MANDLMTRYVVVPKTDKDATPLVTASLADGHFLATREERKSFKAETYRENTPDVVLSTVSIDTIKTTDPTPEEVERQRVASEKLQHEKDRRTRTDKARAVTEEKLQNFGKIVAAGSSELSYAATETNRPTRNPRAETEEVLPEASPSADVPVTKPKESSKKKKDLPA